MEPQQMQIFDYIDTDPQELEPPELAPIVKDGELWQLGDHRLICGDSTDRKVIDKLLSGAAAHRRAPDAEASLPVSASDQKQQQTRRDRARLFRRERLDPDRSRGRKAALLCVRAGAALVRRYYKALGDDHGQTGAKDRVKQGEAARLLFCLTKCATKKHENRYTIKNG